MHPLVIRVPSICHALHIYPYIAAFLNLSYRNQLYTFWVVYHTSRVAQHTFFTVYMIDPQGHHLI